MCRKIRCERDLFCRVDDKRACVCRCGRFDRDRSVRRSATDRCGGGARRDRPERRVILSQPDMTTASTTSWRAPPSTARARRVTTRVTRSPGPWAAAEAKLDMRRRRVPVFLLVWFGYLDGICQVLFCVSVLSLTFDYSRMPDHQNHYFYTYNKRERKIYTLYTSCQRERQNHMQICAYTVSLSRSTCICQTHTAAGCTATEDAVVARSTAVGAVQEGSFHCSSSSAFHKERHSSGSQVLNFFWRQNGNGSRVGR